MKAILHLLSKIYFYTLYLYPASYRKEFQDEMLLDFKDMLTDASKEGILSLIAFCLREVRDIPFNLVLTYLEENRMLRIVRSQPVNFGLRGAVGFGVAFAIANLIGMFVSLELVMPDDSMVGRLQVFYFDLFHTEHGLELISWIPSAISSLLTGLVMGILFAVLFADRTKYLRYILVGMLGWFLHDATGDILLHSYNLHFFLGTKHFTYFNIATLVLSGAFLGLIFSVAKSERSEPLRLLIVGAFAYPLIAYLYVKLLFKLSIITTPWLFIALMIMMTIYIGSVFVLAINNDGVRKDTWIVGFSALGYPLLIYPGYFLAARIYSPDLPTVIYPGGTDYWLLSFTIALSQAIFGILFGLLLGLFLGFQRKKAPPQIGARG